MKKTIAVILMFVFLFAVPAAFADGVHCPEHSIAYCWFTGETRLSEDGWSTFRKYECSCGDSWWVRQ